VVHEWCWNALAKHADIVLPCTTTLERSDVALSPRDPYMVYMQQAMQPAGSSRNDYDIFRGIASHMGVVEAFTDGRTESEWLHWIYEQTREKSAARGHALPDFESFRERGWFKLAAPREAVVMLDAFRRDPDANPLKTPSGKIEISSDTIAAFEYPDCLGHPAWFEPLERLGAEDLRYPLHMISNQPSTKLHSQLDHGSHSRASKVHGREAVTLHPDDARSRNIDAGDVVRIFNARGACLAGAIISDHILPGVIQISTGAWFDPAVPGSSGSLCKHGNPNVLTRDQGTSRLAQGPVAHSCLVEIERATGYLPPVTAFDPPAIKSSRA
jgi:biotin/methionine sulfoxide reductase